MFQINYSCKCLPLCLTIIYIYTAVQKCKKKANSLKKCQICLALFNKVLCINGISSGNPIYYCLNQ